jgi:predicted extracellular nuclease
MTGSNKGFFTILLFICTLIILFWSFKSVETKTESGYEVLFYNVENLFDTENDSLKNDNEFTPSGHKQWDYSKYFSKINNLAKVIAASSNSYPDFIGVCEIENEKVLNDLFRHPILQKQNYQIIHFDSPDYRGIDVGFAYKKEYLKLTSFFIIPIKLPSKRATRDILIIEGFVPNKMDSVRFVINHWPSRFGGQKKSEGNRIHIANELSRALDSIAKIRVNYTTIIMGDFNDTPQDKSLQILQNNDFTFVYPDISSGVQTIKWQKKWYMYDGFLVNNKSYNTNDFISQIIQFPWILVEDKKAGLQPFRSFKGHFYQNGFSDHLPVLLKVQ